MQLQAELQSQPLAWVVLSELSAPTTVQRQHDNGWLMHIRPYTMIQGSPK